METAGQAPLAWQMDEAKNEIASCLIWQDQDAGCNQKEASSGIFESVKLHLRNAIHLSCPMQPDEDVSIDVSFMLVAGKRCF